MKFKKIMDGKYKGQYLNGDGVQYNERYVRKFHPEVFEKPLSKPKEYKKKK